MRTAEWIKAASLLVTATVMTLPAWGQTSAATTTTKSTTGVEQQSMAPRPRPTTMDEVVNRTVEREHALMAFLKPRTPLLETYLQNLKPDVQLGAVPAGDHYFLGRLDLTDSIDRREYVMSDPSFQNKLLGGLSKQYRIQYQPTSFSWMLFADRQDFDRIHYDFRYVRREFLGDVRCIVFDVTPKEGSGKARFLGRIWVEDQDFNIVRLNGTYAPRPKNAYFFHMDSWRLNLVPGFWIPAYIYSEEGDFSYGAKDRMAFKAQTRIWGYDLKQVGKEDELTQVKVDEGVNDASAASADTSPLQAQREWQQQAEDNVIERLESAGLLAPANEVDKVLSTVVNNLVVTNNLDFTRPIRARVILTTPIETFSVGNTIIVSRGLVDVLPDEGSLALVLSHELAHIVLGHNLGSKYAFNDRMLFSDEATYQSLGFRHVPEEEIAADKKALELLKNSPYAQKLDGAGLFLRQLAARGSQVQALLTAHLGNTFVDQTGAVVRMTDVMNTAPALEPMKLAQIAALPLGGRVKLNPWSDRVELVKAAAVTMTSAREKMPLEVTPFFPRLTRLADTQGPHQTNSTTAARSGAPTN